MSGPPHPWRRFWARQLDYALWTWAALLFVVLRAPQWLDALSALDAVGFCIAVTLSWTLLEAAFVAAAGATPGKWLVGLRVGPGDGELASFGASLRRSLLVWLAGMGLGIPLVALFTCLRGYARLQQGRETLWDRRTELHVVATSHARWRVALAAAAVLALAAATALPELVALPGHLFVRSAARDALRDFERDVRERAGEEGIRVVPVGPAETGAGEEGDAETFPVAVDHAGHYAVLAACNPDCGDLDLGLHEPGDDGAWIGEDTAPDALPMLAFDAAGPRSLEVDVSIEHCGTEPCGFAWQLVETSESVAYLWGPGEGTCFAVAPDGQLLTAWHVIAGARSIDVVRGASAPEPAQVVATDEDHDLALLRIDAPTPDYLDLASPGSLRIGARIFTLGYPARDILGSDPKFSEGSVASTRGLEDEEGFFQMSVPIQPGSSGGPVVDFRGRVVGVVNASAAVGDFFDETGTLPQGINWATRGEKALALFDPPAPRPPATRREDAIERVLRSLCRVEVH